MEKLSNRRKFLKSGSAAIAIGAMGVPGRLYAKSERQTSTSRYAMVIDIRRCAGCRGCTVACKSEFQVPLGYWRNCVQQKDRGTYPQTRRHFLPVLCNHCDNAPCMKACPVAPINRSFISPDGAPVQYEGKATYQRPDGIVLVDNSICIGCGLCILACPYGARYFDPLKNAGAVPSNKAIGKCTYCAHRVDNGIVPSCVNTCVGRARIFGDVNDPNSEVSKLLKEHKTQILLPEKETEPQTFYIAFEQGIYSKYKEREGFHDEIK